MLTKLSKKSAHKSYRRKSDNKIVPGASTIAKLADDPGNLINWAWKRGIEGEDYKKVTDESAEIGSVAHFLIQCFLQNNEADLSDFSPNVVEVGRKVFNQFLTTWAQAGLTCVASELELVSELGFGGTLDIVARDKSGELVLVDEKSTPRIYGNHYRQVAAYEALWNENNLEKIRKRVIFRHGKTDPEDVETRWIGDMAKWLNAFLKRLDVYYADKET